MAVARLTYDTILGQTREVAPWEDLRRLRTLAWAISGVVLEQDARLARQALVFDRPDSMLARVRRLERLLDSSLDPHRLYDAVIGPHLDRWNGRTAWLVLDTSAIRGSAWFVRLGLCYRRRAIPIAWRAYSGNSAMVGFDVYRQVLEQADRLFPACVRRCLLADRGFCHLELFDWCLKHGWSFRIAGKCNTLAAPAGRDAKALEDFRSQRGAVRALHTVHLGRERVGPAGLLLSWPPYYKDPTLHVISDDAPGLFTLPDFLRRPAIEEAFRDDKRGGLHLDTVRVAAPSRLDRLLLVLAVAYLYLVTVGDDVVARAQRAWIQPSDAHSLSRFQIGCRYVRRAVWRGEAVPLRIHLQPDVPPVDLEDAERAAREVHHRLGLIPGQVWLPYRSFETENAYWWLPGKVKPRFPDNVWL